jgi:hypothetical protein
MKILFQWPFFVGAGDGDHSISSVEGNVRSSDDSARQRDGQRIRHGAVSLVNINAFNLVW